ncbi:MAG TPA: hypothetical protein VFG24_01275, partial [Nitrosopumilaceae archaeon]|nr:hypothetical protein [Nitrosopumilaceae archaeon]
QNENYILYHSALLVFVLTVIIPINLQLTRFSFAATVILFATGFLSMFMIARNDKVGFGLLKSLRIKSGSDVLSQKTQYSHLNSTDDYQDPIVLMQNFVDELSRRHHEEMDWTKLDSFRMLNARLAQLVEVKVHDE